MNAVQILTLADLDAHGCRHTMNVIRHAPPRRRLKQDVFEYGYHLCRTLEFQYNLKTLLRRYRPELSFDARQL
jgi:hypothetical protein